MNVYQDILKKLEAGEAVALETAIRGESGTIAEGFSRRLTAVSPTEDLKGRMVASVTAERDGDVLTVPQFSNTVKISGDVMYPSSVNYKEGETLSYYIDRAGGYGENARKRKVYAIYMNGSVQLIPRHYKKAIQPGCEIVVPSKNQRNKLSTQETMAIGTSAASVATMMVTIANILK